MIYWYLSKIFNELNNVLRFTQKDRWGIRMEQETVMEQNDFEFDEVRGEHGRKPKMAILNKTKLSKYEMDDLFTAEELAEAASDD
jgi:hypothetical protein